MMKIPSYIHQTWKTTEIPAELIRCVESWKKLNPGWTHVLWTDSTMDSFVKEHFPAIYPLYISYPANIYRADLFRLLVIYKIGGVYADLDMECLKSLDTLLEKHVKKASWRCLIRTRFYLKYLREYIPYFILNSQQQSPKTTLCIK